MAAVNTIDKAIIELDGGPYLGKVKQEVSPHSQTAAPKGGTTTVKSKAKAAK